MKRPGLCRFFFFNDTATTEIYTLSLHDALPISSAPCPVRTTFRDSRTALHSKPTRSTPGFAIGSASARSEEHTSELQSQSTLVCRLLLAKQSGRHDARSPAQP